MNKTILGTGIVFGVTAVLLGAFGAHGLADLVDAKSLDTFETGVTYQMYHAFFLMILSGIDSLSMKRKRVIYYFIVAGNICFSLFLYCLGYQWFTAFDFKRIALVTPLGGTFVCIGWVLSGVGGMEKELGPRERGERKRVT